MRRIDDETFRRILTAAEAADPHSGRRRQEAALPYADPDTARLVDEVAVELAVREARRLYPRETVTPMPHNNPGYDVRIDAADETIRYIEVKGTIRSQPHFFLSEGERLFAEANAEHYTLLVFYCINTDARTGTVISRDGVLVGKDITLRPTQWEGTLDVNS